MFMPDFSYEIRHSVVVITDLNLGGTSVTNGAEMVVEKIRLENAGALALPIIYRDSQGIFDEIVVERGAFVGFAAIGSTDEGNAISRVLEKYRDKGEPALDAVRKGEDDGYGYGAPPTISET